MFQLLAMWLPSVKQKEKQILIFFTTTISATLDTHTPPLDTLDTHIPLLLASHTLLPSLDIHTLPPWLDTITPTLTPLPNVKPKGMLNTSTGGTHHTTMPITTSQVATIPGMEEMPGTINMLKMVIKCG